MRYLFLAALTLLAAMPSWRASAADAPASVSVVLIGEEGEMMTLKPDPGSVKAGRVTFRVRNAAVTERHEMIIARVADPTARLPYDAVQHRVIESKLQALGEVSGIKPGETKSLTVTLKPGKYLLLCNVRGHYEAGMTAPFEVAE
jgi:uncharacterized cupredoxin-like copper-binding protein